MADRKNKGTTRGEKGASSASASLPRQSTFFIGGEGIDREVITTDICRYLGNDALVKPGAHVDKNTGRSQEGFYITAYRPPTSAQLADLRADSQKWREERRNSARPQGDYGQSNTRQEAMRSEKIEDHPRSGGGGYPSTGYGQMAPPSIPAGPTRPEYSQEGYGPRLPFSTGTSGISQAPSSGAYQNPRGGYATADSSNYTYNPVPTQPPYSVMDNGRDRMETASGQPSWGIPPSTGYASSAIPQSGSGYPGRPAFAYPPVGVNPTLPAGYGRGDPPINYSSDPYGPRDSGIPQPEPQGDYYGNDEEMYDDEPSAPPAPTHAPARRGGDRDSRERHDEPRRKGHGHR